MASVPEDEELDGDVDARVAGIIPQNSSGLLSSNASSAASSATNSLSVAGLEQSGGKRRVSRTASLFEDPNFRKSMVHDPKTAFNMIQRLPTDDIDEFLIKEMASAHEMQSDHDAKLFGKPASGALETAGTDEDVHLQTTTASTSTGAAAMAQAHAERTAKNRNMSQEEAEAQAALHDSGYSGSGVKTLAMAMVAEDGSGSDGDLTQALGLNELAENGGTSGSSTFNVDDVATPDVSEGVGARARPGAAVAVPHKSPNVGQSSLAARGREHAEARASKYGIQRSPRSPRGGESESLNQRESKSRDMARPHAAHGGEAHDGETPGATPDAPGQMGVDEHGHSTVGTLALGTNPLGALQRVTRVGDMSIDLESHVHESYTGPRPLPLSAARVSAIKSTEALSYFERIKQMSEGELRDLLASDMPRGVSTASSSSGGAQLEPEDVLRSSQRSDGIGASGPSLTVSGGDAHAANITIERAATADLETQQGNPGGAGQTSNLSASNSHVSSISDTPNISLMKDMMHGSRAHEHFGGPRK